MLNLSNWFNSDFTTYLRYVVKNPKILVAFLFLPTDALAEYRCYPPWLLIGFCFLHHIPLDLLLDMIAPFLSMVWIVL